MLRLAETHDAQAIARIFNHYVTSSTATFQEQTLSVDVMVNRIEAAIASNLPWFVYELNEKVVGYASAARWKERSAYRFTVEVSIYLDRDALGQKAGTMLYEALIDELKTRSYHSAIGVIALPNPASIALHEKLGFEKVAHFKETGYKFGRWIDVGYWQIVF